MAHNGPLEIEIKLALPDEPSYRRLRAALGRPVCSVLQENLFLDGPGGELRSRQAVLRLRREQELHPDPGPTCAAGVYRLFLTLKTRGTVRGSVHSRAEIEAEIRPEVAAPWPDTAAILRLDVDPVLAAREMAPGLASLLDQGGFRNLREIYRPPAEAVLLRNGLWELDRTEFPGGIVEYELEVELQGPEADAARGSPAEDELRRLLRSWNVPASDQPLSKYGRFIRHRQAHWDGEGLPAGESG